MRTSWRANAQARTFGTERRRDDTPVSHVFVVIPVHGRSAYTAACLETLRRQRAAHTTVVVDDGSPDDTIDLLQRDFPDVVLLPGDGRLWWSGGTNRGVAWALGKAGCGDFVLTLNNDTLCPDGYLDSLTEAASATPHTIVGSVTVRADDPSIVVDGGMRIRWATAKFLPLHRGEDVALAYPQGGQVKVDTLSGCGMLIPVDAFGAVGMFDEQRLPQYAADYEFACRAARAGYGLRICADVPLPQHAEATGLHAAVQSGSLGDLVHSLWNRRSANDLRTRLQFAHLACPRRLLVPYVLFDLLRVVGGSLRRFRQGSRRSR